MYFEKAKNTTYKVKTVFTTNLLSLIPWSEQHTIAIVPLVFSLKSRGLWTTLLI